MTLLHSVEDPRNGFQKYRRRQLYYIADQEGIQYPQDIAATAMYEILAAKGVNPNKYRHLLVPDALNGNESQRVEVKVPESPKPKLLQEKSLQEMGVFELRKIAKEKNIPFDKKTKKKELLEKLK